MLSAYATLRSYVQRFSYISNVRELNQRQILCVKYLLCLGKFYGLLSKKLSKLTMKNSFFSSLWLIFCTDL